MNVGSSPSAKVLGAMMGEARPTLKRKGRPLPAWRTPQHHATSLCASEFVRRPGKPGLRGWQAPCGKPLGNCPGCLAKDDKPGVATQGRRSAAS